ncbi:MAG TPA: B12-binding domain-containing radical SAM protein, partial [Firmicutes bacterium]|nr:B12-binding domain-containing radical SAM protein [Bacillota bacterium]
LGPVCVATSISKLPGWDVEVIDENNYRYPGPQDAAGNPDHRALQDLRPAAAVGFYGGLSCTVPRLLEVARFYREAGVLTIGGGHHLDFLPEEALRNGLDFVVHGEGEQTACELLAAWESGTSPENIRGISFLHGDRMVTTGPRPPIADFDRLPLPDFGLLRFARLALFPINRTRGCGMNCEFCSVKGKARSATPERLLSQISYLAETFRARQFFVVDDQFAQNRSETIRFCRMLEEYSRRIGVRFRLVVQIRLDCARDEELLRAMRDCGIWLVAIGIESPIDEELKAMGKRIKASEMIELAQLYHRHGFYIHGMFIFGYPMQPGTSFAMPARKRVQAYRRFIRCARLDSIQVLTPVPIPGSALRQRLERNGRVLPASEIGWEYYDGNFPIIVPDEPLTPDSMHASIQQLMSGFYGFRRLIGVMLHTLRFPFAMLPLVNLRASWRRWYRSWFNDVVGSAGYFIVRNWKRAFREGPFRTKLSRVNHANQ